MAKKIIIEELLNGLTKDQQNEIKKDGPRLGQKFFMCKFHFTRAQMIKIFNALGVVIDKRAINKLRSIKLDGSR